MPNLGPIIVEMLSAFYFEFWLCGRAEISYCFKDCPLLFLSIYALSLEQIEKVCIGLYIFSRQVRVCALS